MPDDLTKRGEPDRSRINVNEEHEVLYWTKKLGISVAKLKEIVAKVGNIADKVRRAAQSM